jgi:hypothetical protein
VRAMVDSKLGYIHKDALKVIAEKYPELALRLKRCSRTQIRVNKKSKKFVEAMEAARPKTQKPTYKTSSTKALANVRAQPIHGCNYV